MLKIKQTKPKTYLLSSFRWTHTEKTSYRWINYWLKQMDWLLMKTNGPITHQSQSTTAHLPHCTFSINDTCDFTTSQVSINKTLWSAKVVAVTMRKPNCWPVSSSQLCQHVRHFSFQKQHTVLMYLVSSRT